MPWLLKSIGCGCAYSSMVGSPKCVARSGYASVAACASGASWLASAASYPPTPTPVPVPVKLVGLAERFASGPGYFSKYAMSSSSCSRAARRFARTTAVMSAPTATMPTTENTPATAPLLSKKLERGGGSDSLSHTRAHMEGRKTEEGRGMVGGAHLFEVDDAPAAATSVAPVEDVVSQE